MFPSLESKLNRYEELEKQLEDPDVQSNVPKMLAVQREMGGLMKVAAAVRAHHALEADLSSAEQMLEGETDPETREYAEEEIRGLKARIATSLTDLEDLATAGDSITRGGLIMEIRAGTGGEEAALFARDLLGMYQKYLDLKGWKSEVLELADSDLGGLKEVTFSVTGPGAFHQLQFESGGHRVQRVPETETQGRIHTSLATVAVMPEADEVEVKILDEDLQIDTMRAGGPGGQKVNKTESAVRITHIPSGIVVKCQDEKSQHKNKAKAMRVLRSRLLEATQQKAHDERAEFRRTLIGTGDRSARIRTYNFPDNRITDHRIGLSIHKLDQILLTGNLDEVIQPLVEFDRQERLRGVR